MDEVLEAPVEEMAEEIPQAPLFSEEEIKKSFEQLLRNARDDDKFVRNNYVQVWRRLEYYWNNILDVFHNPDTGNWEVPDWDALAAEGEVPPRLINIYRPHGEAIVAALSVAVPSIIFHPDDAENPDDVETAKAHRAIVELLQLHNDAPMLLIRTIVILFNQGTVFGYNYYHADPRFGTLSKPRVELKDIGLFEAYCPVCGEALDAGVSEPTQVPNGPQMGQQAQIYSCDVCGYQGPAQVRNSIEKIPQIVGYDESPKGSICQEIYSGLQVKVPQYAKNQSNCGYLLLEFVQSGAMLRNIFRDAAPKIQSRKYFKGIDQFLTVPLQYTDQMPDNACNVSCLWLRPWQFYDIYNANGDNLNLVYHLHKTYPEGCYALFIDDELMDVVEENLDHHWSMTTNPFSSAIYARPLGENLATIQDIRAQLTEIELQTIEYGIPETFVDGNVLDMNKYGEGRSKPGMLTQAKAKAGKSLSDAFHTMSPATLSQEVGPFRQSIDADGQFVVGSFPSIYGGTSESGSKTASEYSQSRAMALQRIGTIWKVICGFWAALQSRSAVEFAQVLKELGQDEKFTKREGGSFINVWIRSASLSGRIGRVEPEATESLPVSWAQKKEAIFQLFQSPSPEILSVLTHPNNAGLMKEIIGVPEFYIPGEEDRLRQQKEFMMMSQGTPIPINPFDNHAIHAQVLQSILESPRGEVLLPKVMQICMQHWMEHQKIAAEEAAQQQEEEKKPQEKE